MSRVHVIAILVTVLAFVVVDAVWLALVAGRMFRATLGSLIRDRPDMAAAAAFYALYALGMFVLVLLPALRAGSVTDAVWLGAVLGLTAYATFDLSNMAVLAGWTWRLALADMAWGTFATALACGAGVASGLALGAR